MKKFYILMVVLATAMMVSCEREKSFNDERIGENTLVISMQGAPSTRSMEVGAVIETGKTIELGKDAEGTAFILEETIQDLNASWAPATKGTPVYTENVGVLYEKMGVYAGGSSNYDFYSMDNSEGSATGSMVGGGWRYAGEFTWPQNAYDFYFWMPKTDNGIEGTPTYNNLSFTFSYTSPTTAAAQKDLIFAARNITKTEAQGDYRINGVPVLFNHALTGVKFAIGNDLENESVFINSVTFVGLKNKATNIVMTPVGAKDDDKKREYRDSITNYTSAGTIDWSSATADPVKNTISSGDYNKTTTTYASGAGSFGNNKGNYPESFSVAGNKNNLGGSDGSQVFWLIPQSFTADSEVELVINYTYAGVTDNWTIKFGKALAGVTWSAGELRTYTIKIDEVNVRIMDEVHMASEQGYEKDTKENVVITNTGNTDAYIRAALVGQWLNDDGEPVFGFTDRVYDLKKVASWYEDQFVGTTPPREQGTFTGLVGYDVETSSFWTKGADGYYYYNYPVPANNGTIPGDYIEVSGGEGETVTATDDVKSVQPLFSNYTVGTAPESEIAALGVTIHFELEIATQAISAKNTDGSYLSMTQAWTKALGYDPTTTNPNAL